MNIDSGYLIISDQERANLKSEFDTLKTIDQKYTFWKDKFDLDYSLNSENQIQENTFTEFLIIPTDRNETEELNRRIYNAYLKNANRFGTISKASEWKEAFTKEIDLVPNKNNLIDYELRKIDDYVAEQKHPARGVKRTFRSGGSRNHMFLQGYELYIKYKKDIDLGEKLYHPSVINDLKKGVELAQYREYVESYLTKKVDNTDPISKLNGGQIILLLHDLGFCSDINDDTLKARIFKQFIPDLKEDTIRTTFPRINDRYNKKSKDALIKFYQDIEYNDKAYELMAKSIKGNKAK